MESLRSRLQRRAALRRELPCESVDAEAVRRFWFALSPARRLDALRFDDPALVQRMHNHMTGLCRAELWCQRNLVASLLHGPPGAGQEQEPPERLRGFAFEAPAETDCIGRRPAPIAFAALSELAESDSLFEEMRKQLGSGLLEGRPALDRRDWAAVAEPVPSSWQELQRQAFRLVELAIFQAQQDAAQDAAAGSAAAPLAGQAGADAAAAAAAAAAEAAERSRSKRKAKKAKAGAAKAAAKAAAGIRPAGPPAAEEEAEEEREDDEAEAAEEEAPAEPVEMAAGAEDVGAAELGQQPPPPPPPPEEKSPGPPPPSRRPEPRRESVWSAWLPNLLKGDQAEWRWVIFQPATPPGPEEDEAAQLFSTPSGVKAVVKNTFLDIEHDAPVQASPARKSCYF